MKVICRSVKRIVEKAIQSLNLLPVKLTSLRTAKLFEHQG